MNLTSKLAAPILGPTLLGTLASCGGTTPSDDLYITAPVLTSGYVSNLNQPLICDNRTTPMEFGFLYSGNLQTIKVTLVGVTSGKRQALSVTGTNFSGGSGKVIFSLPAGTAPLSIPGSVGAQSIVVTPNVIGYSELEMQGFSSSGVTRVLTSNAVAVVNNCGG